MDNKTKDKLYITEIINDLERHGYLQGGNAQSMLYDWAAKLREENRTIVPASRLRRTHANLVGKQFW